MKRFLRENWLWIAAPLVIVAVGVLVLRFVVGGEAGNAPFNYPLF